MISSMAFSQVLFPLSVILRLIQILILTIAMFLVIQPFSIIETTVHVSSFPRTFPRTIFLLPHIQRSICQIYFGYLRRIWIKLRLENSTFVEVILAFSSFLIFKIVSFEIIPIFVFVFALSMFQSFFEKSLEENFLVFIEFAFSPETIMLPLARILINSIKPIVSIAASLSFDKLPLINIAIVVDCFAESMGLRRYPRTAILLKVIILDWLELVYSFTMGLTLHELAFIGGAVCEFEQAISLLLVILPFAIIYITICITIHSISMFGFALQGAFVSISIAQLNQFFLAAVILVRHISYQQILLTCKHTPIILNFQSDLSTIQIQYAYNRTKYTSLQSINRLRLSCQLPVVG